MLLGPVESSICDVQGALFEKAADIGLDSEDFALKFMDSLVAKRLDLPWDRTQWAGEGWLMAELRDSENFRSGGEVWDRDVMFWLGYTYRVWRFTQNMPSREIVRIGPPRALMEGYPGLHTLDCADVARRFCEAREREKGSPKRRANAPFHS